jgi:hypothetical protein
MVALIRVEGKRSIVTCSMRIDVYLLVPAVKGIHSDAENASVFLVYFGISDSIGVADWALTELWAMCSIVGADSGQRG